MAEKKVNTEKKIVATAGTYGILRRPIISEKAAVLSENNAVAFEVAMDATKEDVARAMQAIYNVKPTKVPWSQHWYTAYCEKGICVFAGRCKIGFVRKHIMNEPFWQRIRGNWTLVSEQKQR